MTCRIVVLVGTDHHPFNRLVAWADALAANPPKELGDVELRVQYGTSTPNTQGFGASILQPSVVAEWLEWADVAVVHGGPGTITAARSAHHRPVVVPRNPDLGEHVDGHQQRFAAWIGGAGSVAVAHTESEFRANVTVAAAMPKALQGLSGELAVQHAVTRAAFEIERSDSSDPARVIYLGGIGRSGTTLLELLLACQGDVCGVGETVHLWQRGVLDDELCGCGQPFSACEFWTRVGADGFGGWSPQLAEQALHLKESVDRTRHVPRNMGSRHRNRPLRAMEIHRYGRLYHDLYHSVLKASGASAVLDSSKHVSLASLLALQPGVDLRLIHMVRDPRAVAYSWTKKVSRPEARVDSEMPTASPSRIAARWTAQNSLFGMLAKRVPTLRVNYEDLVEDPNGIVAEVRRFADLPVAADPVGPDGAAVPAAVHSVAGNPLRFNRGSIRVGADDAWRTGLSSGDQRKVTLLTRPLSGRYGRQLTA